MEDEIRSILRSLGEDPERAGLRDTPRRYSEAMKFFTRGYHQSAVDLVNGAIFDAPHDEMITIRDIDFYSLCEHHLLPFFGKCHVAYIPAGKIIGLSKIPRIVDHFSRRLQIQENLTVEIAKCLDEVLKPLGVAVVVDAFHLCMAMRGVEKQSSRCITSTMRGAFRKNSKTRNEFMNLITSPGSPLTR